MRKNSKKKVVLWLQVVLLVVLSPMQTYAAENSQKEEYRQTEAEQKGQEEQEQKGQEGQAKKAQSRKTAKEVKEQWERSEYREGEAVVVFTSNAAKKEAAFEHVTGETNESDMELKAMYTFGEDSESYAEAATGETDADTQSAAAKQEEELVVGVYHSDTMTTRQMIRTLEKRKEVEYAEPNYIYYTSALTNDPYAGEQWALQNSGQNGGMTGNDVGPEGIWDSKIKDIPAVHSSSRVVALVDTGIDVTHEDLSACVWVNPFQGKLPGEHGYDFVNADDDPQDDNGHGTHCAGIISAVADNEKGISGICPGVQIMALKALDQEGEGTTESILGAFDYIYRAKKLGVDVVVVNNSWSGTMARSLEEIIGKLGELGTMNVFAAGNEAQDMDEKRQEETTGEDGEQEEESQLLKSPYVINVAAVNEKGNLADYSNYGNEMVDLAAPGSTILSTVIKPTFSPHLLQTQEIQTIDQGEESDGVIAYYRNYEQGADLEYVKEETGNYRACQQQDGYPSLIAVRSGYKTSDPKATVNVSESDTTAFGTGHALKVAVTNVKKEDVIFMVIPYTLLADQQTNPSVSMMLQGVKEGQIQRKNGSFFTVNTIETDQVEQFLEDTSFDLSSVIDTGYIMSQQGADWKHVSGEVERNKSGMPMQRALVVQAYCEEDGDYSFYLDDFGVSKGLDKQEKEKFGKYEYFSGTSMAAPLVTGAVALLAEADPKANLQELRARLCSSVRQTEELKEKTISGGILDLRKLEAPIPIITDVTLDEKNDLHIKGYGFVKNKTDVNLDGTILPVFKTTNREIVADVATFRNKSAWLEVTTPNGTFRKNLYLVKGSMPYTETEKSSAMDYIVDEGEDMVELLRKNPAPATDGKFLYFYNTTTELIECYSVNMEEEKVKNFMKTAVYGVELVKEDVGTDEEEETVTTTVCSNLIYSKRRIYFLARVQPIDSVYYETKLYYLDLTDSQVKQEAELPKAYENITDPTLGAYDGEIYLIGGYDYGKKTLSKNTYYLKKAGKKGVWKKSAALPQGCAAGHAVQAGDRLYYALGVSKKGSGCPSTLVFDGKTWRTLGKRIPDVLNIEEKKYGQEVFDWYTGNVSPSGNQLYFTGMASSGLGDTFMQNLKTGTYRAAPYYCLENPKRQSFTGMIVGDKLIGFKIDKNRVKSCYVQLKDTLYHMSGKQIPQNGRILCPIVDYLPGEKVTVDAVPDKGYYLLEMKVNGKKVASGHYEGYPNQNIKVSVKFGAYVTSVKLKSKKKTIQVGKQRTVKAAIIPKNAENKDLIWKSSNKKYATVDKNGKVKAKKAGIGKNVVITAKTKDGSKIKEKIKFKIKK